MAIDPTLRRLALRTLLAAYPGSTPPPWALDLVGEGLAGYTLFGFNIVDRDQVAASTAALRAANPRVIVAIDEEGGDVTRLAHRTGSPYPGNAALGALDDVEVTRAVYRAIGADLAAVGVTVDLAPTVDVNTADDNPIIGTRSFGADTARVAAHTRAAVEGLQEARVAACAKHFPGHGATVADSHLELPTVDVPLAVLRERDLPPFAAAVAGGTKAMMTAHIRVPELTGDAPATFSRAALHDLLRGELGFDGTLITDALEMKGAAMVAGGTAQAAPLALAAGADLLCIGADIDAELVEETAAEIVAAIQEGRLDVARVEEAAERTAALAAWAVPTVPAGSAPESLGYDAARRAVRVEGDPLVDGAPLVVELATTSTIAEGRVPWGLRDHVDGVEQIRAVAATTGADELVARAGGRPIVVVARHAHRLANATRLIEDLAARHPVTVVEMGWPSSWRPAGVRAFVTTYGASHANGRAAAAVLGLR
ncbi:glycoside hydrolase family 3 N-terminal domain-containing protein [Asanoa sp. WMMD1127]|uniref:glycoside hydrolase family 3 protein n=1 Tax=Asanoa sp. WMMD1127 TaxID=3016107 RepID=UPI002415C3E4|nr:glycoside hydrolase family 3 N-terminal domain-containing protein [Asanoa sp. WMMD1127]MDG4823412.1 glycoside hydrolase family 3 N-terminal domain-containing protein [Asanoa sp. WMMD1127]